MASETRAIACEQIEHHSGRLRRHVHAIGNELHNRRAAPRRGQSRRHGATGTVVQGGHSIEEVRDQGRRPLRVGDHPQCSVHHLGIGIGVANSRADSELNARANQCLRSRQLGSVGELPNRPRCAMGGRRLDQSFDQGDLRQ